MIRQAPERNPQRLYFMDALRAFAMLMVVTLHVAMSLENQHIFPWPFIDESTSPAFSVLILILHDITMPLTFFIAGFFAHQIYLKGGVRRLITHRVWRIGLPFLIGVAIFMLFNLWESFLYAITCAGIPKTVYPSLHQLFTLWTQQLLAGKLWVIFNNIGHLWFLYDLILLYLVTLGCLWVSQCVNEKVIGWVKARAGQMNYPLLLLIILTSLCLLPSEKWYTDTSISLIPDWHLLGFYGVFYGVGWYAYYLYQEGLWQSLNLFAERENKLKFMPRALSQKLNSQGCLLLVAIILLTSYFLLWNHFQTAMTQHALLFKIIALICYGSASWFLLFTLLKVFSNYFNQPNPLLRYCAEASYWIYLIQIPIIVLLQEIFSYSHIPLPIKFLLLWLISVSILLLSYRYLVRGRFLGRILNGETVATI